MSSCWLMFSGVRFLWCSQDLDLSLLLLVFSLIFTVASRLLHLYSTIHKTSRLKMKSFSTLRYTQRGSQSYIEKRGGRRAVEVTRMRWGGIKRGESKLGSNHFLMCSPQSGPLRDVHGVTQRRRGRKKTEVARRIKWGIKRRETDPASNQFLKCFPLSGTHKKIHRVG